MHFLIHKWDELQWRVPHERAAALERECSGISSRWKPQCTHWSALRCIRRLYRDVHIAASFIGCCIWFACTEVAHAFASVRHKHYSRGHSISLLAYNCLIFLCSSLSCSASEATTARMHALAAMSIWIYIYYITNMHDSTDNESLY